MSSTVWLRTDDNQLKEELLWGASRPGSLWKKRKDNGEVDDDIPDMGETNCFMECLTEWESNALEKYIEKKPNSVYSMNQDPTTRPTFATGQVS